MKRPLIDHRPIVDEWEARKTDIKTHELKKILVSAYEAGILPGTPGGPWPSKHAGNNLVGTFGAFSHSWREFFPRDAKNNVSFFSAYTLSGGISPEQFDKFHELVVADEIARCGSANLIWAFIGGMSIGLPPIKHFGSE